jgi:hypothetical protein
MRAIQLMPALYSQKVRGPIWMAHTPVGHDNRAYCPGTFRNSSGFSAWVVKRASATEPLK